MTGFDSSNRIPEEFEIIHASTALMQNATTLQINPGWQHWGLGAGRKLPIRSCWAEAVGRMLFGRSCRSEAADSKLSFLQQNLLSSN
jgi:hypothetical protein